jgi:hypothetical protein
VDTHTFTVGENVRLTEEAPSDLRAHPGLQGELAVEAVELVSTDNICFHCREILPSSKPCIGRAEDGVRHQNQLECVGHHQWVTVKGRHLSAKLVTPV